MAKVAIQNRGGFRDATERIVWKTTPDARIVQDIYPIAIHDDTTNCFQVDPIIPVVTPPRVNNVTRKSRDEFFTILKATDGPAIHDILGCRLALFLRERSIRDNEQHRVLSLNKGVTMFPLCQYQDRTIYLNHYFSSQSAWSNYCKKIGKMIGSRMDNNDRIIVNARYNSTSWSRQDLSSAIFTYPEGITDPLDDTENPTEDKTHIAFAQGGIFTETIFTKMCDWKKEYDILRDRHDSANARRIFRSNLSL